MAQNVAAIFDADNPASPLSATAAQTALFLMDYHNFLLSRGGDQAAAAVLKAKSMREWATTNGVMIVHCLVDMQQASLPTSKGTARFKIIAETLAAQPSMAEEHPHIAYNAASGEHMVSRRPGCISALKSPGLEALLSTHGVKSVILCGIATSGCVLSTARAAGDDGYIVTVIEDACSDPGPGLHAALVQKVLPSQAHVATVMEFQEQWSKAARG